MAQAFTHEVLSGSTNGLPVKVVATATAGTTVHTAIAGTTSRDEIWLYAHNNDTVSRTLTVEFGGVSTDDNIVQPIPAGAGVTLVLPGLPLRNGLVVGAFASAANVVFITGYVNRVTVS